MKKKKRTVPRFSIAAGLTWRMGILVGILWFTAMSLLTVISAQQLQEQWTQHTAQVTAFSVPERDDLLPGEIERLFIHQMYGFDIASDVYLNLPLYKDPTLNRATYKPRNYAHETAMVFRKDGVPLITPGEYVTFEYLHEDSWLEGKETPDGYGYIDLEDLRIPDGDVYRLTGYFEGNRFVLNQLAGFQVQYPVLYAGKTLAQWEQERGLKWEIHYENPNISDQETVCIYTTLFDRLWYRQILHMDNEPSYIPLEKVLLDSWPQRHESRSLWETVIIREGNAVLHEGSHYQAYAAIRCYPLLSAMDRLAAVYWITELICVLSVVLYYRLLKRRIRDPLQQIISRGQQNMLPLNFPYRPKWKEPYLLEEVYMSAQGELQTLRQENVQLKTALEYAEHAETNRRQLVSNITHELKTPLAVIRSYCEGLQAGIAPEKQEKYLNVIMEEADRMDAMVLEMLDLSRLEAGKVRLAQDRVELLTLTRSILEKLQPLLEVKELSVDFAIKQDCRLIADEGRLAQVITNLISNAIKYSPERGKIIISLFQRNGFTHFSIENESPPLSEEALEKVWDSFYRADQSRTTKGTGLGLSICKAIIELHRGTCQVKNTSTGVEFGFSLPG
jgi:signal transduction histidine kinase